MGTKHQVNMLVLEKFLLGELRQDKARELEQQIARDPSLKMVLEDIKRSNGDFLLRFPSRSVVPAILKRYARISPARRKASPSPPARPWKRLLYLGPLAAATAALALLLVLRPWESRKAGIIGLDTSPDTTVIKGLSAVDLKKTQLLIFRRRGDEAELMRDGQSAAEGDLLQLAYVSGAESYGLILSLDGRGRVTRHFPMAPGRPNLLEVNAKVLLPVAIELDDAPRFERFILITSDSPIDEDDVLRRATALASDPDRAERNALELPGNLKQFSLILLKGSPR